MSRIRLSLKSLLLLVAGVLTAPPLFAQQYVAVNFPDASYTSVNGMDRNNAQVLVGDYMDSSGATQGFIHTGGSFLTLNYPGAAATVPQDVNDLGQVVGQYYDDNNISHGFLLSNGSFFTKDFPNVVSSYAGGINNAGQIVGGYTDNNGIRHGFLYSGGEFSTLDVPGATGTSLAGINNQDNIAGTFTDAVGIHAFLLTSRGITTINAPNSSETFAQDLNDANEIVGGYYQTGQTNEQAFTYSAGTFTNVVYPGALTTDLTSLSNTGVLTGDYASDGSSGGFVQTNGPFAYLAGGGGVSVLDTQTNLIVTTISVPNVPFELVVAPDQLHVYVCDYYGSSVSVIDTATNSVVATIPVGLGPYGVTVTPNGGFVYVANSGSGTVSVISTASNTVTQTVTVGPSPTFPQATPNGGFVYISNQNNTISVIDTSTNTVTATVSIPGPTGLAFTPNGALAYVAEGSSPGNVTVLAIPRNNVVATIPLGIATASPIEIAITPDGAFAYVTNLGSNNVSVINTSSNSVIATVPVGSRPFGIAVSPDGSLAYVGNDEEGTISVISTSSNAVIATVPVPAGVYVIAIASAPPKSQTITQPLNPMQPNQFNFGPHNLTVQYPPGTSFSNVNMNVTAAQATQETYQQSVAGTPFANSTCIVYSGTGGNCVNYQVTCSDMSGSPVTCPAEPTPNISVKTSYDTLQTIVNPGFLTAPIGTNEWQNIFSEFYLQRIDPSTKGFTKGFSQFYAVALGASNSEGAATFTFLAPLLATDSRVFGAGTAIPVEFQLTPITKHAPPITNAVANLTVVMVTNESGNPESKVVRSLKNAFEYQGAGDYLYQMNTTGLADGTYVLTVYGNEFAAQQVQFSIKSRSATKCVILPSPSSTFSEGQPITFTVTVTPARPATGTPTGTVTFQDNAYSQIVLGTASVVGGEASVTAVLQAPPDRQFVNGVYSGDNNFKGCESPYTTMNYLP